MDKTEKHPKISLEEKGNSNNMFIMKRIISLSIVLLLVFGLLSACGKTEQKLGYSYLDEWQVGGQVNISDRYQLFARVAILNNETTEVFSAEVMLLPDKLEVTMRENKTARRHYFNFYVKPKIDQVDIYPFKIVLTSEKNKHELGGKLEILKNAESVDTLFGGHSRSQVLPEINLANLYPMASVLVAGELLTGPVSNGTQIFTVTKNGDIFCFDENLEVAWNIQVSDAPIDTLQIQGEFLIISTVGGLVKVLEISKLSEDVSKPVSTLNLKSRLSGTPTIISKEKMVVGTSDGKVLLLSIPNLKINWKFQTEGAITGSIPAVTGIDKSGNLQANIFVANQDRKIYYLDIEGNQVGFEDEVSERIRAASAWNGRVAFTTEKKQVRLRNRYGMILFDMWTEKNIEHPPSFNGEYIATVSKNRIFIHDLRDGYLQLNMKLDKEISGQPIIMGDTVLVFLVDGSMRILNITDGIELRRMTFGGELLGYPIILDSGNFAMMNTKGSIFMWGERKLGKTAGAVNLQSLKYFGGRGDNRHTGSLDISLPENPQVKLRIQGKFAPAIITEKYLFLYDITNEEFSCRLRLDGAIIWSLKRKSTYGVFMGAGMDGGPHECPLYLTEEGLYLATENGLLLVSPETGEIIKETGYTGIPQIDNEVIVLTSKNGITCLDRNLKQLWKNQNVIVSSGSVCIDGDEVILFDRNGDSSRILVLEKLSGKVVFEEKDSILQLATKLAVSNKHVITGTFGGTWIMTRNPYQIIGAVNGTNNALNPIVVDGAIASMFDGSGVISKYIPMNGYSDKPMFEPPIGKDGTPEYHFFSGNEFVTNNMVVGLGEKIKSETTSPDEKDENIDVRIIFRNRTNGWIISSIVVDNSGCSEYAMTAGDGVVAVCNQGIRPELILIGE